MVGVTVDVEQSRRRVGKIHGGIRKVCGALKGRTALRTVSYRMYVGDFA